MFVCCLTIDGTRSLVFLGALSNAPLRGEQRKGGLSFLCEEDEEECGEEAKKFRKTCKFSSKSLEKRVKSWQSS